MASWMVHFRIADLFLNKISNISYTHFIVGNIAPDSGEPNEDWSKFTPPSEVSHFLKGSSKSEIMSDKFFEIYLVNKNENEVQSFYLGYYIHLLTDILWSKYIVTPLKEKFKTEFENDKNFIWTVKKDWYDLDHLYLKENPNFRTFRIFESITSFPNNYLDFYSNTAFEKRIKYISDFYNNFDGELNREYIYLTKEQVNEFVNIASKEIEEDLISKNLI